jgi:hypothetical protein
MPRIDLDVAFTDRNEVKLRGARWDPVCRMWYVPDGIDPAPFRPWIPVPPDLNVRAPWYFLGTSTHECEHCGLETKVHGFVLPAGHAVLNVGDFEEEDEWEVGDEPSLLCSVEYVIPSVARLVTSLAPTFRPGFLHPADSECWLNFCEHCGAALDDEEIFCEPGMGFLAFTEEDARRVALLTVREEFGAVCGSFSMGVALIEEMAVF